MTLKLMKKDRSRQAFLNPQKASDDAEYFTMKRMTDREKDVFVLIKKGLTSKECATALKISVRTVELHRANIIHKYQVRNIVELVYRIKQCRSVKETLH